MGGPLAGRPARSATSTGVLDGFLEIVMDRLKWAGDRRGALQNFIALGDWATYYAANTEFAAAEWLHKNGYLEKREVAQGKRKVHEYRLLGCQEKILGTR